MPELDRHGYDRGFSSATIAVGGTLGILIPPSVILVVYAITTEQNIAKLFQAALIPGVLAAAFYCIAIALMVKREPALAPLAPPDAAIPTVRRPAWQKAVAGAIVALAGALWLRGTIGYDFALVIVALAFVVALVDVTVLPAITVAVVVVGGIYGGIFTPTEGASVGAVAMLGVGLAQRSLGWREIVDAVRQTAETSGMIFMILLGAEVFGAFLALARLPTAVADFVGGMGVSPYIVLVAMLAIYILLGAVMDELAMILLTLPVFFPIVQALDFGMTPDDVAIWFGILVLIVVGIGLTAPPIGLNVFVISAITRNVPIEQTYRRVLPFIAADVLRLALVVAVPGLALWLVRFFA
jgi:TRAP-type C4-dicarboxylate transport system permease large subunit